MDAEFSRRDVLKGMGAIGGLATLGALVACSPKEEDGTSTGVGSTSGASDTQFGETADLVIVGAGTALYAALRAAELGLSVIVLEKRPYLGGEASLSGGIIYAGGNTATQQVFEITDERTGKEDTLESTYDDWTLHATEEYNPELVKKIINLGPEIIQWFIDHGVEFSEIYQSGTDPIKRGHQCDAHTGGAYTTALVDACEAVGVKLYTETWVAEVLTNDRLTISGVKAVDSSGGYHYYGCKTLILAAGGTANNKAMAMQYNPESIKWNVMGSDQNSGDGFYLADKFDVNLAGVRSWLDPETPCGSLIINIGKTNASDPGVARYSVIMRGYQRPLIFVNLDGKRFTDETKGYPNFVGVDVARQSGGTCYNVMDSRIWTLDDGLYSEYFDITSHGVGLEDLLASGDAFKADTLEELAEKTRLPLSAFSQTIEEWNTLAASGVKADEFGRPGDTFMEIDTPPFYAWKCTPTATVPFSGAKVSIDINENCKALNRNGQVIPGLYIVGTGTSQIAALGHGYAGSGTCLASGFAMGIIAAESIAVDLGK
jgi:fumarate reductase flavoprotein subunit